MGARTDEGGHTSQVASLRERDAKVVVSAIEGIDEGGREGSLCIGVCNPVLRRMSEGDARELGRKLVPVPVHGCWTAGALGRDISVCGCGSCQTDRVRGLEHNTYLRDRRA